MKSSLDARRFCQPRSKRAEGHMMLKRLHSNFALTLVPFNGGVLTSG